MSIAETPRRITDDGSMMQHERTQEVPNFLVLQLPAALQAEALTETEDIIASSATTHIDLFIKKWRIHLQESLIRAKESEKRFPTLQGYTFAQWASFGGPSQFAEKGARRFSQLRILGREIYKNGQVVLPTIDYIERTLYNLQGIDGSQSINVLAEEANAKYPNGRNRFSLTYVKPTVDISAPTGEELVIDIDKRSVDLLLPVDTIPLLTQASQL